MQVVRYFFITNSPSLARFVTDNGVDRIFVDLELLGKEARQGHLNTVISRHSIDDVQLVRGSVPDTELMVRVNPINSETDLEVSKVIDAGADIIMLPMFRTADEVRDFVEILDGRARLCLLAETAGAMNDIAEIAAIDGVDEIHIGLNDLSLDLGLGFMFSPFPLGIIDRMTEQLSRIGKPYGIGGLARADEGLLPARLLLGEHVRVGSTAAILSRTFHRQADSVEAIKQHMDFKQELTLLRQIEEDFRSHSLERLEENRKEVWSRVSHIVDGGGKVSS